MEKAKKMVLISTENLEKMQQMQQQQNHQSENVNNTENDNNKSVRTPGTPLSRLDAEMCRILNLSSPSDEGERWKMYKEVLQRYLYFVRDAKKRFRKDSRGTLNDEADDKTEQDEDMYLEDDDTTEFTRTLINSIGDGGDADSFGKKRDQSAEMIKNIIESVPKTYRYKAHTLLKYLLDAPASKIAWDKQGLVTINGAVVTGSNISDLINDTIRERKTVKAIGRVQFARLLHDINIPPALIGNRSFLHAGKIARRIKSSELAPVTSTPKTRRGRLNETAVSESGDTEFMSADEDETDQTLTTKDENSPTKKARGLFGWSKF